MIRKLKGSDLYKMSKIIKKINVDFNEIPKEGSSVQIGLLAIKMIIESVWQAEDEINDFFGSLIGCTGEEFAEKDITEVLKVINEFKNIPEVSNFLSGLGQ